MADGEARPEEALAELAAADVREGLWSRVRAWRQTPFIVWALVSALALTGIVFWHTFTAQHILESADARTWFLAATTGFWLPLVLLFEFSLVLARWFGNVVDSEPAPEPAPGSRPGAETS